MHAGGADLGPVDPYAWLCGFVDEEPNSQLAKSFKPLAERLAERESEAVAILLPDDSAEDWPQEYRSNDGIGLEELGRHSGAAKWAIRAATIDIWQRCSEGVPTRAVRKIRMKAVLTKAKALLGELRTLEPHDIMALQQAARLDRSRRMSATRWLPARPDLDGEGALLYALKVLVGAAEADLKRLDESGPGRWPDLRAGVLTGSPVTAAHIALPIWLHFRPDKRPTSYDSAKAVGEGGSFFDFVICLHEIATGRSRDVKPDIIRALDEYAGTITMRYSRPVN